MQDIFSETKRTNLLVEEGKEVLADRKLQGIRTKMLVFMKILHENLPDNLEFIHSEESKTNVAQTNLEK